MRRLAALFLLALLLPAAAAAEKTEERVAQGIESVIDGMDFAAVEDVTLDVPGWPERRTLEQTVQALAGGEGFSADDVLTAALGIFMREVGALIQMMLSVMLPVVLASLLMHTLSPQSDSLSAMSRSACFVLVLTPVIVTTLGELSHTRQTIVTMTRHMERLLPMLLTLLTALGGSASSAFLHPMVAAASGSMVFLAREVILRLVMCTCAVTAVNHLSDRAHLTRMAQLLRGAVCWLLGVSFTVFLGAMSLQGVTSASIDGVAIRAAKYAVDNFVPVVGGMFSDTMDTLVGCTLIVKNALGVAAVLVLVGALVGFLWYNSFPAQIFMGDTGSLSIGGIIAVFALCIRKELLLPLLCGVFLVESFSVMMQVGYFKYTKRKYGEGHRLLLMAPVHHHFQKKGQFETKIVLRFWIISLLLAAITLVTLKIR